MNLEDIIYPFRFPWQSRLDEFFYRHRIFLGPYFKTKGIYRTGELVTIKSAVLAEPYSTMTKHGFFSCGSYSYSWSKAKSGTNIGRYCSIAGSVSTMGDHHPIDRVSTSIVSYSKIFEEIAFNDFGATFKIDPFYEADSLPTTIGNDVWIGEGVLLKGGIKIGDGAIVAARSIVTHDVPPYAIVAGAPATVKRMRFPEETVERLRRLEWWRYNFFDLPSWSDVDKFIGILSEKIERSEISPYSPAKMDVAKEIKKLLASKEYRGTEHKFIKLKMNVKKAIHAAKRYVYGRVSGSGGISDAG